MFNILYKQRKKKKQKQKQNAKYLQTKYELEWTENRVEYLIRLGDNTVIGSQVCEAWNLEQKIQLNYSNKNQYILKC